MAAPTKFRRCDHADEQIHESASVHDAVVRIVTWLKHRIANLRQITGDDAYERYLAHHQQHHPDQVLLDRRAYYLAEQQRKWTGVKRCC